MLLMNDIKFATNIGVLFDLKTKKGFRTLQETYKVFESTEMDNIIEVLCVSYNRANNTSMDIQSFIDLLDSKGVGFLKIAEIYKELVEAIMFSGMTPEEIEERKNLMMNQK